MSKNEFLEKLRMALNGKVSPSLVRENMGYYNEYIDSEIRLGKSEQEVMDMLGDPRLIARTIIQTNEIHMEDAGYRNNKVYNEDTFDDTYSSEYERSYDTSTNGESGYYSKQHNELKVRTIPGWVWAIILIVVVVCILSFVFSIVSFLMPLLLPLLIVLFFIKLFRDWLN